jgi:hypothetical protein
MLKLITLQGIYYLVTGLWPVIDIHSFMLVTGYKTDVWLVHMVGLLSCGIGITLLYSRKRDLHVARVLALCTAAAFALIDIRYVLSGTLLMIYLADAAIELLFIVLLLVMRPPKTPA